MDDSLIVDLFFERDEQAIRQLQQKYGKLCLTLANRVLGNEQDAEECVNDTYAQLWNSIPPTRPKSLKAFACSITRNLALKRLEYLHADRRSTRMTVLFGEDESILPCKGNAPSLPDEVALADSISAFLRRESPVSRDVFLRRYYFFDAIEEIAHRHGFSQAKVKSMLHRTKGRLLTHLKKEGFEP